MTDAGEVFLGPNLLVRGEGTSYHNTEGVVFFTKIVYQEK